MTSTNEKRAAKHSPAPSRQQRPTKTNAPKPVIDPTSPQLNQQTSTPKPSTQRKPQSQNCNVPPSQSKGRQRLIYNFNVNDKLPDYVGDLIKEMKKEKVFKIPEMDGGTSPSMPSTPGESNFLLDTPYREPWCQITKATTVDGSRLRTEVAAVYNMPCLKRQNEYGGTAVLCNRREFLRACHDALYKAITGALDLTEETAPIDCVVAVDGEGLIHAATFALCYGCGLCVWRSASTSDDIDDNSPRIRAGLPEDSSVLIIDDFAYTGHRLANVINDVKEVMPTVKVRLCAVVLRPTNAPGTNFLLKTHKMRLVTACDTPPISNELEEIMHRKDI